MPFNGNSEMDRDFLHFDVEYYFDAIMQIMMGSVDDVMMGLEMM